MRSNSRPLPIAEEQSDCPAKRSRVSPSQDNCPVDYKMEDMLSKVRVMQLKESTTYRPRPYLDQTTVTAEDRCLLCQWGFDISNVCRLNRCIAVIAIGYFDRFFSHRGLRTVEVCLANQREFQLAFVMCLVIALKGRESMDVTPTYIAESICEEMYLTEEIVAMEIEILRTLNWQLNGPTAHDYLLIFMELLPPGFDEEVASSFLQEAIRKLEIALFDYRLALEAPSSLAIATVTSMVRAMDIETKQALKTSEWMRQIRFIMGISSGSTLAQHMEE